MFAIKTGSILTNRGCYSATNEFVSIMKYAPQVTVVGDKTGGGSGLPFSSELPNGWSVRFSASPMFNAEKQHIEFGVDPDVEVMLSEADADKKIDTIIETARTIIEKLRLLSNNFHIFLYFSAYYFTFDSKLITFVSNT